MNIDELLVEEEILALHDRITKAEYESFISKSYSSEEIKLIISNWTFEEDY